MGLLYDLKLDGKMSVRTEQQLKRIDFKKNLIGIKQENCMRTIKVLQVIVLKGYCDG